MKRFLFTIFLIIISCHTLAVQDTNNYKAIKTSIIGFWTQGINEPELLAQFKEAPLKTLALHGIKFELTNPEMNEAFDKYLRELAIEVEQNNVDLNDGGYCGVDKGLYGIGGGPWDKIKCPICKTTAYAAIAGVVVGGAVAAPKLVPLARPMVTALKAVGFSVSLEDMIKILKEINVSEIGACVSSIANKACHAAGAC